MMELNKMILIRYPILENIAGVEAFTTTRMGGSSEGNYSSLNMGFHSGDNPERVRANRERVGKQLSVEADKMIFPKQTHSAHVKMIDEAFFALSPVDKTLFLADTDALVTQLPHVCIAVKTADCVPVLLFDPVHAVAAAIHAGWRGTLQQIVRLTVETMQQQMGCLPENMVAAIGPAISAEVYEVGEEVWCNFDPRFLRENRQPGKRLLDLREANRAQLLEAGVPAQNIGLHAEYCSYKQPEMFYSARRDGAKTGRMASGIVIRK